MSQAIFPFTHDHVSNKLFQTSGRKETTPTLTMTTKMLIKQTSFVVITIEVFQKHTFFV